MSGSASSIAFFPLILRPMSLRGNAAPTRSPIGRGRLRRHRQVTRRSPARRPASHCTRRLCQRARSNSLLRSPDVAQVRSRRLMRVRPHLQQLDVPANVACDRVAKTDLMQPFARHEGQDQIPARLGDLARPRQTRSRRCRAPLPNSSLRGRRRPVPPRSLALKQVGSRIHNFWLCGVAP